MNQTTTEWDARPSRTYKFRVPHIEYAIYFTIVGTTEPEAFFVNSKEMESFQWITALMTAYSRQLRAGVPVEKLIEDMREAFDPNGSYVVQDGSGREVQSIIHHMGLILEEHVEAERTDRAPD